MRRKPASSLTSFAIGLYSMPEVSTACLQLQSAGQDVCLLLCSAWLYQREVACTPERVGQLVRASGPWQSNVVTPLRTLRRGWKDAAASDGELSALREKLKGLELEAEMTLLKRLEAVALQWPANEAATATDWLAAISSESGQKNADQLQVLRSSAVMWPNQAPLPDSAEQPSIGGAA